MAYFSPANKTNNISSGRVTVVDCEKQVRSWRLLRCVVETLVPCCNRTAFINDGESHDEQYNHRHHFRAIPKQPYFYRQPISIRSSFVTGTFFGTRRGKVSFCIQTQPSKHSKNPDSNNNVLLLLELAMSTRTLATEMRGGFLRIVLESTRTNYYSSSGSSSDDNEDDNDSKNNSSDNNEDRLYLLSTPVWKMNCNGRGVGFAMKRQPTEAHFEALSLIGSGAGVVARKELGHGDEIMYLRAMFERVYGSLNSESYHLVEPDRSIGQELSVFFYR